MCDFASFVITDKGKILVHDMLSHAETAKVFKLIPDTYREVEWVKNDNGESLTVRFLDTDSIIFKKAKDSILSHYPNRSNFLDKFFTKAVQLTAVKQYGNAIEYITNPSEAVQLAAVKQYGCAINYIKNPSEAVKK